LLFSHDNGHPILTFKPCSTGRYAVFLISSQLWRHSITPEVSAGMVWVQVILSTGIHLIMTSTGKSHSVGRGFTLHVPREREQPGATVRIKQIKDKMPPCNGRTTASQSSLCCGGMFTSPRTCVENCWHPTSSPRPTVQRLLESELRRFALMLEHECGMARGHDLPYAGLGELGRSKRFGIDSRRCG
jgi:hypothetical protein